MAAREKTLPPAEDPKVFEPAANLKRFLIEQETQAKRALHELDVKMALVQSDFSLTEAEKFKERNRLLDDRAVRLREIIRILKDAADAPGLSSDEQGGILGKVDSFTGQLDGVTTQRASLGADPESLSEQMTAAMTQLQDQAGTMAQGIARTFKSVIGGAVDSISRGITGLIHGTLTWGQALRDIGTNLFSMLINEIIRMGVQWVVTHVLMEGIAIAFKALLSVLGWAQTTEVIAQESAKSPSLATNAALASAGSYGLSAVIGIAILAALIGFAVGALAFAEGGPVSGPGSGTSDSIPAYLSNGEWVVNAEAASQIGPAGMEMINDGSLPVVAQPVPVSTGQEDSKPNTFIFVDDRAQAIKAMRSSAGRAQIVDIVEQSGKFARR